MIYFIRDRIANAIKIGTAEDSKKRLAQLQTGNVNVLSLIGEIPGGQAEEARLHERFKSYHARGEWFVADPALVSMVVALIEGGGMLPPPVAEFPAESWISIADAQSIFRVTVSFQSEDEIWHPTYGRGIVTDVVHGSVDHDDHYRVFADFDTASDVLITDDGSYASYLIKRPGIHALMKAYARCQ